MTKSPSLTLKMSGKPSPSVAKTKKTAGPAKPPGGVPFDVGSYETALVDPFTKSAYGARVPDLYSFPTEVAHITTSYTISTDSAGNCGFAMFSNPLIGLVNDGSNPTGTRITGGALRVQMSSIDTTGPTPSIISQPIFYYQAITEDTLAGRFDQWRTVSVGVRVKPLVSYTNAPGKIHFAQIPAPDKIPRRFVNNTTLGPTTAECYDSLNIPVDSTNLQILPSIINLPMSGQMSMTELLENGNLCGTLKHTSPNCFEFLESRLGNSNPSSTYIAMDSSSNPVYGTSVTDAYATSGWSMGLFKGIGLPASTNVFEIEVIYHLEGSPQLSVTAGTTTLSAATSVAVVNLPRFYEALTRAAQSPAFRFASSAALTALKTTVPGRMALAAGDLALRFMGSRR